ncbi:hypothetical protein CR513_31777, partial [Mucuna pruriens]
MTRLSKMIFQCNQIETPLIRVQYILGILPQQHELLTMHVQDEERLMEEFEKVNLTTFEKKKYQAKIRLIIKKTSNCFFYKNKGHMKTYYIKFKNWLDKKYILFAFVCYESNMVSVNHNTWWVNSSSIAHFSNTL